MTTLAAHAKPRLRPPEDFFLPRGYRQQPVAFTHDDARADGEPEYWNPERVAAAAKYQYHVYRWAAEIIRDRNLRSVLDVGCGPGIKLGRLIAPRCSDIEGIDQPSAVAAAAAAGSPGKYTCVDLERPGEVMPWRTFDLIICADVLEHLIDPDPCMDLIRRFSGPRTVIVVSTPDRTRLHGRECMESTKPEHVREWAMSEFERYVESRGVSIEDSRVFPADDAPMEQERREELLWRAGEAKCSPHRCHAILGHFKREC